eukprot:scaffold209469_cov26-Tisochrysis_lutea.AAC.1
MCALGCPGRRQGRHAFEDALACAEGQNKGKGGGGGERRSRGSGTEWAIPSLIWPGRRSQREMMAQMEAR